MTRGRLQSDVWRELEAEEGKTLRALARSLLTARSKKDWPRVEDVARALFEMALVKDPPEGEDE